MIDIVQRLRFDAVRCEATFSKGVAGNISEGVAEIERLRAQRTWLSERLHDAVNTCYGGVTHGQIDACSFEQSVKTEG